MVTSYPRPPMFLPLLIFILHNLFIMLFVFSHHCPVSFIKAEFYMFLFFLWSSTHDMAECGNKQMLFTLSLLGQVSWPQSLSIHRDLTAGRGLGRLYSAKRDLRCALIGSCQPGEANGRPIIDRSRHFQIGIEALHKMCSFFLLLCGWLLLIVQFSELRFPSEMPSHCYCLSFISLNNIYIYFLLVATLLFNLILIFYPSLVQWVQSLFPWSLHNL